MDKRTIQTRWQPHWHPRRHEKPKPSPRRHRLSSHVTKKTLIWRKWRSHGYAVRTTYLKLKQKTEAPQRKTRPHVPTQIPRRRPPHPNHTPIRHTNAIGKRATQGRWPPHRHPSRHEKLNPSPDGYATRTTYLKLKQKTESPERKLPSEKSLIEFTITIDGRCYERRW